MRWKSACASVTGSSHTCRGESGQDFCRAGTVQFGELDFFIGIAADGAGSTTDGGRGAEITCTVLYARIMEAIRERQDISLVTDEDIRSWVTAAREAVAAESRRSGRRLREYACTVLGAVAGNGSTVFFQIGDGAIVSGTAPEYRAVFWPEQGEYANTTFFLTDEGYGEHLQIDHAGPADEIALFTDGLQNLVLSFAQKKAHTGFFVPLFAALRKSPADGAGAFTHQLGPFLSRNDISARSDDDKTLVLGVRVPC